MISHRSTRDSSSGAAKALAVCAFAASMLLASAGAHALGLLEAYRAALQNDPTYKMAIHDNEAGQEYRIQGRANLLPSLSASYYTGKNRTTISAGDFYGNPFTTHQTYSSISSDISLRQPLVNFDALARYRLGEVQTAFSNAQFSSQKQELVTRLVGAYLDALYADDQVRLATAQRDMYAEQRQVNDTMFQKGEGTRTDMIETQARLDASAAQLLEAQDQQLTARQTLAGLVGREVRSLDGLPADFRAPILISGSYEEWEQRALAGNPDLLAQKQQVEGARQQINLNRAGHAPRLELVSSISKNRSETINVIGQESVIRAIGLQLTVPLYSGGAISSNTRQAVANYEKAQSDLDARTEKLLIELRKQYNQVQTGKAKIAAQEKSLASARLLVEATTQSIKGGVRINLDLLTAVQQLYTAQRDLAQARYTYLLSTLRLRSAGGVLSERDVQEVAGYFSAR